MSTSFYGLLIPSTDEFIFQAAVSLGTPVMTEDWVKEAWNHRNGTIDSIDDPSLVSDLLN